MCIRDRYCPVALHHLVFVVAACSVFALHPFLQVGCYIFFRAAHCFCKWLVFEYKILIPDGFVLFVNLCACHNTSYGLLENGSKGPGDNTDGGNARPFCDGISNKQEPMDSTKQDRYSNTREKTKRHNLVHKYTAQRAMPKR